jgi:hypothetical protein
MSARASRDDDGERLQHVDLFGDRQVEVESEATTYAEVAARVRAELVTSSLGVSDEVANNAIERIITTVARFVLRWAAA